MKVQASSFGPDHPELYGTDAELTLYYDETNNIRKLRLRENGLSDDKNDNFVLGGIVLKPGQSMRGINELRKILHIQENADEIHFGLVAKGNFERVLDSKKLKKVFSWLMEQGIGIHFVHLNILNWSILDIIESIIAEEQFSEYIPIHRELKNELYRVAIVDLPSFLLMLTGYGYPDIQRESTGSFINDIRKFIQKNWPIQPSQVTEILNELLAKAVALPELTFLVNEQKGVLINGFDTFFLNRVCMFKKARHVFDEEKEVQAQLSHFQIMDGEREVDFSFVNSKSVAEIQISDIVVGFLGKYFSYIEKTPLAVLLRRRKEFSGTQLSNLALFKELIDISDRTSNGLLHRVTTMDSDQKSETFLHGSPV